MTLDGDLIQAIDIPAIAGSRNAMQLPHCQLMLVGCWLVADLQLRACSNGGYVARNTVNESVTLLSRTMERVNLAMFI